MQFRFRLIFLIINLTSIVCFEWDKSCKINNNYYPEKKQHLNKLLCQYDKTVKPPSNRTQVHIFLFPSELQFDDFSSTMTFHATTSLNWNDIRLTWDKEEAGHKSVGVKSKDIWVPEISVLNTGNHGLQQKLNTLSCYIYYYGEVYCVFKVRYVVRCETDYTSWPFDEQNCTIHLGSWAHTGDELILIGTGLVYSPNIRSNEWLLDSFSSETQLHTFHSEDIYSMYIMHIKIKRYINVTHTIYTAAAAVLVILTLTALWLDPRSYDRLILTCINFICHLLCMQDLQWRLPWNGQSAPIILLFYEKSLILTAFTLILTEILRKIQKIRSDAPKLLSSTMNYIFKSNVGQILLKAVNESKIFLEIENNIEAERIISLEQEEPTWKFTVVFIRCLSFLIVFLMYLIIFAIYIP